MENNNLYFASIDNFDKDGFGTRSGWGFYVSAEKCKPFTIKAAQEILKLAIDEHNKRFGENADFNYICVKLENGKGEYWRDKNLLRIWKDDLPVYENNNGVICRDSAALADCLM